MYRILIADDEPIERKVVGRTIEQVFGEQLEVMLAANGREAIELFQENGCEVAILDIEMPGINGLEAAETIRKVDKNCSIIFLTAFDEFDYAKKAISVRAMDYLLKPCSKDELSMAVEEAIRIRKEAQGISKEEIKQDEVGNKKQSNDREEEEDLGSARMNAVAESIRRYIHNHYMEDISLQDVAGELNYSDAYFCKIFKHCFNKSFVMYLSELRMKIAKELLADARINIKDISTHVGYRDSNYFTRVFKRMVGVTPSEYRIQMLQKREEG